MCFPLGRGQTLGTKQGRQTNGGKIICMNLPRNLGIERPAMWRSGYCCRHILPRHAVRCQGARVIYNVTHCYRRKRSKHGGGSMAVWTKSWLRCLQRQTYYSESRSSISGCSIIWLNGGGRRLFTWNVLGSITGGTKSLLTGFMRRFANTLHGVR